VIYPGNEQYALDQKISVIPIASVLKTNGFKSVSVQGETAKLLKKSIEEEQPGSPI
jgi:hypothetical protein